MSYRTFWCIISLQTKKYERKWSCTTNLLYNEKTIIGRLYHYFYIYFEACSIPTAETLVLLLLSILTLESADSIRFLYRHFLSKLTDKSLNAFYYACSYAKVDYSRFMNATASMALKLIPKSLETQPVFFMHWWYHCPQIWKEIWGCLKTLWPFHAQRQRLPERTLLCECHALRANVG